MPSQSATVAKALLKELEAIAQKFSTATKEAHALAPAHEQGGDISTATAELEAAIHTMEEAANAILDAVELVQNAVDESPLAKDQKVNDALMEIITACNFQDLSGQRIRKVASILEFVEPRTGRLIAILTGGEMPDTPAPAPQKKKRIHKDGFDETALLNGPQSGEDALSQEDIDALFDKS